MRRAKPLTTALLATGILTASGALAQACEESFYASTR